MDLGDSYGADLARLNKIEVESDYCLECGEIVWLHWDTGTYCDDEDCGVEHECNP